MTSNWRPSLMPALSVESKPFPIFQPDLDWETANNKNNPFSLLTAWPLNSEPVAVAHTHFLPYPTPPYTINVDDDNNNFSYPDTGYPQPNFCTFVKPESGDDMIGKNYDEPAAFLGHPVCGNLASARIDFGLNLGHRTYFSSYDAAMINRLCRSHGGLRQPTPRCQAEGCEVDLSNAKHYHRRHKVCEFHSKATIAVIGGTEQRFCQQCSRFHVLAEFDEVKRSCRKRLADHNRRRRKTHSSGTGGGGRVTGSETKCIVKGQCSARYSKNAFNNPLSSDATTEQTKSVLSQMASSQTSDSQGFLRAASPSSPPFSLISTDGIRSIRAPQNAESLSADGRQLLQRGPYLSLTPPSLFPWITESINCATLNVSGHHHQSPWCSRSLNNGGSDELSRGSVSYERQSQTEELQKMHCSVFVDQM